jgi:hypothetical protein
MRLILCLILLTSLLSGCSQSPRKNYYLLSVPPTEQPIAAQEITTVIGVGPIEIAEYLNRLHIVYQTKEGSLVMAENDYWAEPLNNGITRALTLNLTQSDNSRSIVSFPWRQDSKPHYSLRLKIYGLDRVGDQAKINATWELIDNSQKQTVQRRHFIRTTESKPGAKALAQAYSQLIAELAAKMDKALKDSAQK